LSLTITGRNVSHKPIIVTGEYAGANAITTLPLGFVPRLLFILDETNRYTWTWAYGFGWSAQFENLIASTDADRSFRSRCIFQYLGKELEDNPNAGEASTDNPIVPDESDYAEPFISGDDDAGVIISKPAGTGGANDVTAAGGNATPNESGVSYLFWAIG